MTTTGNENSCVVLDSTARQRPLKGAFRAGVSIAALRAMMRMGSATESFIVAIYCG